MTFLLHQLLSEGAARDPESVAVRHAGESLSYGELERSSNQLAGALRAGGVAPGDRVLLHLHKSLDAIVSVFGVLKAGACFVPVDPSNPARRLADIARQCAVNCIVASPDQWQKFTPEHFLDTAVTWLLFAGEPPAPPPLPVRCSTLETELGRRSDAPPPPPVTGTDQDLAYVLFTSGSTGQPKGVMLSHLNALTFVNWGHQRFRVRADDRLSNHAPLNFDLSIFDIFVAIKAGASVSLVPEGLSSFPTRLADLIESERITIWYSVPSILRSLLARGRLQGRDLSRLRLVLFAGEVFPVRQLRELMEVVPHPRYFNLYGPTETNVCAYYEVERIGDDQEEQIPIGRPCENTDAFAIDERGALVTAPGHEGLLHVRGSTVMQGYYGRPEETEATFVPNPFSHGREARLYCTQDWVTLDAQGDFRFLGRKDQMVKTGGYRVELGEIEAALHAHPAVREAVAVAVPDDRLGSRIKAIVVAEGDPTLTEQDVKRYCGRRLPKYMVPQEIQFRPSLPRTQTDKVDRGRLRRESLRGDN